MMALAEIRIVVAGWRARVFQRQIRVSLEQH